MKKSVEEFFAILTGFRKFVILLLALLVTIVFVISGHMSGSEFVDLHKIVIPAFMGANMLEHGKDVVMEMIKNKVGLKKDE